ncbi:RNA-binding protein [Candidatus Pacearchaeota archaeon]|nr:RNA-binding protein [Candidatus Pacearchaeota archaeon]
MSKRLFVGNLPFSLTQDKLKELFAAYGSLGETVVVTNKFSGRSKGFGFVTVEDDSEAEKAISDMDGKEIEGRKITVNEARPFDPDKPRPPRREFGGRRFGGGDRGGFGSRGRFGGSDGGNRSRGRFEGRRERNSEEKSDEDEFEGEE